MLLNFYLSSFEPRFIATGHPIDGHASFQAGHPIQGIALFACNYGYFIMRLNKFCGFINKLIPFSVGFSAKYLIEAPIIYKYQRYKMLPSGNAIMAQFF